jgi:hypothetical protein
MQQLCVELAVTATSLLIMSAEVVRKKTLL